MRFGAVVCKIVEASAEAALSEDVFRMASGGGAEALNRLELVEGPIESGLEQ